MRREVSPTCTLKWTGRNRVQIMCNTTCNVYFAQDPAATVWTARSCSYCLDSKILQLLCGQQDPAATVWTARSCSYCVDSKILQLLCGQQDPAATVWTARYCTHCLDSTVLHTRGPELITFIKNNNEHCNSRFFFF